MIKKDKEWKVSIALSQKHHWEYFKGTEKQISMGSGVNEIKLNRDSMAGPFFFFFLLEAWSWKTRLFTLLMLPRSNRINVLFSSWLSVRYLKRLLQCPPYFLSSQLKFSSSFYRSSCWGPQLVVPHSLQNKGEGYLTGHGSRWPVWSWK